MGEVIRRTWQYSELGCEERDVKDDTWVSGSLHLMDGDIIQGG